MITVTHDNGLVTVTLTRPGKANALSADMLDQLISAVKDATAAGFQALILTGEGRVFSAGADLDEARTGLAESPLWERLSAAVAAFPGLSVAALNGKLAGGAFGMTLACDIRVAVPSATFFYPVMKHGFLPQPSDPVRMAALIGPARTKMILVAGQRIGADEALAWGLIDRIAPADGLMDVARELVWGAISGRPGHAAAVKATV